MKIAVVEDEMIIAANINDTLEELGYEVFEPCISYIEAVKLFEEVKPDLVLLEIFS